MRISDWSSDVCSSDLNELGPNRDYGVQLGGSLFDDTLDYAVGVFNGAPDGRDGKQQPESDNRKEIGARLFAELFKTNPGFFQGLGFGVRGSIGQLEEPLVGKEFVLYVRFYWVPVH